jgi:hypothetical protein
MIKDRPAEKKIKPQWDYEKEKRVENDVIHLSSEIIRTYMFKYNFLIIYIFPSPAGRGVGVRGSKK